MSGTTIQSRSVSERDHLRLVVGIAKGGVLKRRLVLGLIVFGALLGAAVPALADPPVEGKGKDKAKDKAEGLVVQWKATSPAIHEGDQYTLVATNTGDEAQKARVRTVIMDHRNHVNTDVVDERVELAPGEEREFAAANDYGEANHFNTIIFSENQDLALAVQVTDSEGVETARFNDAAFMVQQGKAGGGGKTKAHNHGAGFVASVPAALWNTARLSPLSLGFLAVAGMGFYAVRRRAWAASGGSVALPRAWRMAAVGGLVLSAALHVGLAPAHFGEAAAHGIFFFAAGAISAIIAAAVLTWPSRPAYLAGAAFSLALIALWVVFLLVPPPGSEAAETVDLVGLVTKATELVAATACLVLWNKDRSARPSQTLE